MPQWLRAGGSMQIHQDCFKIWYIRLVKHTTACDSNSVYYCYGLSVAKDVEMIASIGCLDKGLSNWKLSSSKVNNWYSRVTKVLPPEWLEIVGTIGQTLSGFHLVTNICLRGGSAINELPLWMYLAVPWDVFLGEFL